MKYLTLLTILISSTTVLAQLDSCGKDYRPIRTLNNYEVEFLNSYMDTKPIVFNDSIKIAFVNGLGGGPLIVTKQEFFKYLRIWEKSDNS